MAPTETSTEPRVLNRVLIIDDDSGVRTVLRYFLERDLGVEVEDASSGAAGLSRAWEWQPELVLLDLLMPQMDGLQTLEALRLDPGTRHIPVVIMSASAPEEWIPKLRSLWILGILAKPFSPETVGRDILEFFDRASSWREVQ
ncbi:MAG: response regulator [Acidobacteria bacterium]|nr:response regulator [Acidobacteriota bacterium]